MTEFAEFCPKAGLKKKTQLNDCIIPETTIMSRIACVTNVSWEELELFACVQEYTRAQKRHRLHVPHVVDVLCKSYQSLDLEIQAPHL